MIKKFLVATDLSARSDRALQRAVALAHERTSEVDVLHVVDGSLPEPMLSQHEAAAKSAIGDQITSLGLGGEGVIRTSVVRGQDYIDIVKQADSSQASMIVLGVPRQTGRGMFGGTTAEKITRSSRVPVLLVRSPVVRSYQRVLVAVDLSVHSRRALQVAAQLVPKSEFFLVHALHEPFIGFLGRDTIEEFVRDEQQAFRLMVERDIGELNERFGSSAPGCVLIFNRGMPQAVIQNQIEELKPDLVVVGTHGRTGIAGTMLGSVAEDVLADAPVDVLAVKAW